MGTRGEQSVPFYSESRPEEVLAGGVRLDGRSFEEFRNVCESLEGPGVLERGRLVRWRRRQPITSERAATPMRR